MFLDEYKFLLLTKSQTNSYVLHILNYSCRPIKVRKRRRFKIGGKFEEIRYALHDFSCGRHIH